MDSTNPPPIQRPQAASRAEITPKAPLAIYIHWPFCLKKCPYCDFNSHVRANVDVAAFETAYLRELRYWHETIGKDKRITSIFFGGGTPSLMPPALVRHLLETIQNLWEMDADCEITLEANPTSVEAQNFASLAQAGINRVSLGMQSLDDADLQFLGREHSVHEALQALKLAQTHFTRCSFDLIYALPKQSDKAWEKMLTQALSLGTSHLSLYQLTIEENTGFHHAYHVKKQFTLPDEARAARLYTLTQSVTEQAGMAAYEISNHARPGEASRHNLTYWRAGDYLGIGAGAHGRITTDTGARLATENIRAPERWCEATQNHPHGLKEALTLTPEEILEERILMGLRLVEEGLTLPLAVFETLTPVIADLRQHGLLAPATNAARPHLRLTHKGTLLTNYVAFALCEGLGSIG